MSFVLGSYDLSALAPEQAFLKREPFGIHFGERVERFTFGDVDSPNASGHALQVSVLTYGATVQSVKHRRASGGGFEELTLGYDTLKEYVEDTTYMGTTVGRYANRIRDGRFVLPGLTRNEDDRINVQLLTNEGLNTLHGGPEGFSSNIWKVRRLITPDKMEDGCVGVVLGLVSFDGDQGFPGTLDVEAHFLVRVRHGEFKMRYVAKLVEGIATVCNLTNHCYWNLGGCVDAPGAVVSPTTPGAPAVTSATMVSARSGSTIPGASPVIPYVAGNDDPLADSCESAGARGNGGGGKPPMMPRANSGGAGSEPRPDSKPGTPTPAFPVTHNGRHCIPSIEGHFIKLKSDFYLTTLPGEPVPDGGIARIRNGPVQSLAMLSSETTFRTVNGLLAAEAQDEAAESPQRPPVSRSSIGEDGDDRPSSGGLRPRRTGSRRNMARKPVVSTLPALDHCFVLRGTEQTLRPAVRVWDTKTGRQARVWTTLPSLQVYTGNFLPEHTKGRGATEFGPRSGFCLETQMFPDAPNHPHFPSTLLRKGDVWDHETMWTFD